MYSKLEVIAILEFNTYFEKGNYPILNWTSMRQAYLKGFMTAIKLANTQENNMATKPSVKASKSTATKAQKLIGKKKVLKKVTKK